jgi:GntR family transcriptional regulator / MocR family aminotransferase
LDDYDNEFRYGGRPIEPLCTLDGSGRVIYVGSFSKSMFPTPRLGFIAAPPSIAGALRASYGRIEASDIGHGLSLLGQAFDAL